MTFPHALGPLAKAHENGTDRCLSTGWDGVPYPVPLPGDPGLPGNDAARLKVFEVRDTVSLPAEFKFELIASWGDRIGTNQEDGQPMRFGFNCDFVGLVPMKETKDEFWMVVNHEYISARPWIQGQREEAADLPALRLETDPENPDHRRLRVGDRLLTGTSVDFHDPSLADDETLRSQIRKIALGALTDLGVSAMHVRIGEDGSVSRVRGGKPPRRCSGADAVGPSSARDATMTGPALRIDGFRSSMPPRTFSNCSGCITPWGTFLSCEENFQQQVWDHVTPSGKLLMNPGDPLSPLPFAAPAYDNLLGLPYELNGLTTGADAPGDGRYFGWVCEFEPETGSLSKHTALGRFRHENVAMRCQEGKRLAAYMGDDRRGGHVYKFASKNRVQNPRDPQTRRLLHEGTLYAARWRPDFTGSWIPLVPETPLQRPRPEQCANGFLWLPNRPTGGTVLVKSPDADVEEGILADEWVASIEAFCEKTFSEITLGDLVEAESSRERAGILVLDAYAMANAAGATPTARPEDIEVHPDDNSVYIAFTDSTGKRDGSPDRNIFPDSACENSRQYGAIYRLAEDGDDPGSESFTWGKFVASGEAADGGGGFACADNLAFDPEGNLWVVTDITTYAQNAAVDRKGKWMKPGEKGFPGVFGNNAIFMIPTSGPDAGIPRCFATAPMESEFTGLFFTPGGESLLVAIQHPGERHGARSHPDSGLPGEEVRRIRIAGRDGKIFTQTRSVPIGSNFPSGIPGKAPRPSVINIRRK